MSSLDTLAERTIREGKTSRAMSGWRISSILLVAVFFALSLRWSLLDNSPPAWDQGLYLFQASKLHLALSEGRLWDFVLAVFNVDRGRVPLMLVLVQPAFSFFGTTLDVAVITLNLCWFPLGWAVSGIASRMAGDRDRGRAGFFAIAFLGLYPLTVMLTHQFLVELLLVTLICASIHSLMMLERHRSLKWSALCGLFVGLGLLTKVTFAVFVFPTLLLTVLLVFKDTAIKRFIRLFLPGFVVAMLIAAPYYFYNFNEIMKLTTSLSSKELASLYGFGNVFDLSTILDYWKSMFWAPIFVVVFLILTLAAISIARPRAARVEFLGRHAWIVLSLWFLIPFCLATFGQIKDPRYLFPGLVPVFILAGLAVSLSPFKRFWALAASLVFVFAVPGYLYSNAYLSRHDLNRITALPGMSVVGLADPPPDPRDWHAGDVVSQIARSLEGSVGSSKIIFLGGNRYYHLRLLDYEGLKQGVRLDYVTLPYYSDRQMTVEDALAYIRSSQAAGVIFKSGENWPEFSSRLDLRIVEVLKKDPGYVTRDLGIEQPDGSRFIFFKNKAFYTMPVTSPSEVAGDWTVGGGVARMSVTPDSSIAIRTETGAEALGILRNGSIHVDQWNVSGRLTVDLASIQWSNGSMWRREARR